MPVLLPTGFDSPGFDNLYKKVTSGEAYFARDGNDFLFSSESLLTFRDGSYWNLPSGLSGGIGDDSYVVGFNDFAVIADAGFGSDDLTITRDSQDIQLSARIDGRHFMVLLQSFPGSSYQTMLFMVDVFKPEGSIEKPSLMISFWTLLTMIFFPSYNHLAFLLRI